MKMLDFNAVQQPTWQLKLKDKAQTIVNLSYPTLALAERLAAVGGELKEIAASKDGNAIRKTFDVVAEVMSCNEDGYTFTAEELVVTYHMTMLDVAKFISGYMDFLHEANEAKN
jgi:hypothetical protein